MSLAYREVFDAKTDDGPESSSKIYTLATKSMDFPPQIAKPREPNREELGTEGSSQSLTDASRQRETTILRNSVT